MYQLMQLLKSSIAPVCRIFIIFLFTAALLTACSKKDAGVIGKPGQSMTRLQFKLDAGEKFDEQTAKDISLKLQLSVSGIDLRTHSSVIIWDTLITKNNLYEYLHSANADAITTSVGLAPGEPRRLIINYLVIYNNRGELITRSGAATLTGDEHHHIRLEI
jgi:hypothetical protein